MTKSNKEITLSNKVNIEICGMKDPKALSLANSNFTFVQAP